VTADRTPPEPDPLAPLPPGVLLAREVAGAAGGDDVLRRAVRAGQVVRVRTGAYVRCAEWSAAGPEDRHRMLVDAVGRQFADPVFSHESAAVLWRLPLVTEPRAVHVLGPRTPDGGWRGAGVRAGVARHGAPATTETTEIGGVRCTSARDTVLALAGARDLLRSLPVVDRAVRDGVVTAAGLREEIASRPGRPGSRRAAVAVALADARPESVGESVSRARIHLDGLEAPQLQQLVRDRDGPVGRVDFWWPGPRVAGEFDGRLKYRVAGLAGPPAVEDRLWAEKRREDRIRHGGIRVVRWTWADLWRPGVLRDRLLTVGVPRRSSR
jgi:hypothetical protein